MKVKSREVDVEGNPIEKSNPNTILEYRLYKVDFIDGTTDTLVSNVIAQKILYQVDDEGRMKLMMD